MIGVWFVSGASLGILNALVQWWTVVRLRPEASSVAVLWVAGGAMLRWVLAAGLLITALQQGIAPGLLAFAGLWLGRWGLVCWLGLR